MKRLFVLSLVLVTTYGCTTETEATRSSDWWKNTAFYQIYPRSFKDSDADGIGDLNGITSKLDHLVDAGIGALWLSPIYVSPMADFGYDIANFTNIAEIFGTLDDFDRLVARAKELGLRVILDFVPNHSSDEHPWFLQSINREEPYTDYYVWLDGIAQENGSRPAPPNNWISFFGGSAWEWNEQRGQYYLHQFAIGQPDLNYRNDKLQEEMRNVLLFWLKRGIDGFRIDAINTLFEDPNFPNEELTGDPNSLPDEPGYIYHIYSQNLNDTYDVLRTWRETVDAYAEESGTDAKVLISEAYTTPELTMRYYSFGSIPFNFWLITDVNRDSSAAEIKAALDKWLDIMPENEVANWVVGNHDQHRVATRYGVERSDQMTIVCMMLPGISVTYNGDEIGMVNTDISWEESVDPAACYTDPDRYTKFSRDPERTPFQWDSTTSAGFSVSNTTWLPVNPNYVTLNLAAQKTVTHSHYRVFQAMTTLRRIPILQEGSTQILELAGNVLAIVRQIVGATPIVALVNCDTTAHVANVRSSLNLPENMIVYTSGVSSEILPGTKIDTTQLNLPGAATVVLTSEKAYELIKAL